ncbi:putative membrane protein [Acinetobacter sp. 1264765]|nr:putative membrane protein [Acinetobacter sp. 1264765]
MWSTQMVTVGLFIIFNGLLFGYLLLKISSILNHLENNKN